MKNYKDVFMNFWNDNLTIAQSYQCFNCSSWEGVDIHHIKNKGMGGSKNKCFDYIENLTCLCRTCHIKAHKDKDFNNTIRAKTLHLIADRLDNGL